MGDFLLILAVTAVFTLGYFMVGKWDKFLARYYRPEADDERSETEDFANTEYDAKFEEDTKV